MALLGLATGKLRYVLGTVVALAVAVLREKLPESVLDHRSDGARVAAGIIAAIGAVVSGLQLLGAVGATFLSLEADSAPLTLFLVLLTAVVAFEGWLRRRVATNASRPTARSRRPADADLARGLSTTGGPG